MTRTYSKSCVHNNNTHCVLSKLLTNPVDCGYFFCLFTISDKSLMLANLTLQNTFLHFNKLMKMILGTSSFTITKKKLETKSFQLMPKCTKT